MIGRSGEWATGRKAPENLGGFASGLRPTFNAWGRAGNKGIHLTLESNFAAWLQGCKSPPEDPANFFDPPNVYRCRSVFRMRR